MFQTTTTKEERICLVEEFYKEFGRLPKYNEKWKGAAIGPFLKNIRDGKTLINEDQINRLSNIGFYFQVRKTKIDKKITLLEEFYSEFKRLPKKGELFFLGGDLYYFLNNIRNNLIKMSFEQMDRLYQIGFSMNPRKDKKDYKITLIEEFYREFKRLPKMREKAKDETEIGSFLYSVRHGSTILSEEQLERLSALGFEMEVNLVEEQKEIKVKLVEEFYQQHKRLPKRHENSLNGIKIGRFLTNIKEGITKISEGQMDRLIVLGFPKEVKNFETQKQLRKLTKFYKERQRLPYVYEPTLGGASLDTIILAIQKGDIKVTPSQLIRLQKMGFQMKRGFPIFEEKHVLVKK